MSTAGLHDRDDHDGCNGNSAQQQAGTTASLPEAVLKFRQGIGRLIRSTKDRGIVTILDSRVSHQWYGRLFLDSIDECPVETVEVPGLER